MYYSEVDTSPKTTVLMTLRFFMMPTIFILYIWYSYLKPEILKFIPRILKYKENIEVLEDQLPLYPTSLSQAFELGKIFIELGLGICKNNTSTDLDETEQMNLLAKAKNVLPNREREVLLSEMVDLPVNLKKQDEKRSLKDRVLGFFTFVNVIWCVSIVGIASLLIPFSILVFGEELRKALSFIWEQIYPVLNFLHQKGIFEILSWCVSTLFISDGLAATPHKLGESLDILRRSSGFYYMLTGLAGVFLSLQYSEVLFLKPSTRKIELFKSFYKFVGLLPLMAHFQSKILAFILVGLFYSLIGFFICVVPGVTTIGFDSEDSMLRCIFSSSIILFILVGLRVMQTYEMSFSPHVTNTILNFLSPALMPASIIGTFTLDLAFLILSSWNPSSSSKNGFRLRDISFFTRNFVALCVYLLGVLGGSVFKVSGLVNTSIVFLIFWCLEKFYSWTQNLILIMFPFFIGLYFLSMWIHKNPGKVVKMFTWSIVEASGYTSIEN